jgi:hypothetical protein
MPIRRVFRNSGDKPRGPFMLAALLALLLVLFLLLGAGHRPASAQTAG